MIVASLLLILVAVVLLVLGLAGGSSFLLVISIAASLLAAVALVVGARQAAANRAMADPGRTDRQHPDAPRTASQATPGVAYGPPLVEPEVPVQHVPSTFGTGGTGWRQPPEPPVDEASPVDAPHVDDASPLVSAADGAPARARPVSPASPIAASADDVFDPAVAAVDEPAAQQITAAEAARVARLLDAVEVVDGRPRYHLDGCPHLIGWQPETLPVAEAVELGFTPCAHCAPATALLADARPI
ncbi:hypothetical protein AB0J94_23685 [Micromonospora noduli]|uniref:Uncharacterized protein n=1 Tax=Micromonospora noduli TaxID=709876 RepID=A0ABX9D358_9ACTN|nr:hypothetical protein [Micromonospora noduli]RAO02597.1 hypothetical protein GUI43_05429 [Micromonospora noduli]RAO20278.1 hypothetical protein MED15_02580 [Micromonospora noduli]RAO30200.1 hypothetical protein ONO23_04455 [Micromonospora noduli]RAO50257.1 hypothetical protein ONO86_02357 [Micromonospora noduli]